MELSTWTYPWDVARLGADTVLADLAEHGVQTIDLAATYHPISAVSPRGTLTPFFSPAGAVFFPARADRYSDITPSVWPDRDVTGAWPAVSERLETHGLTLDAWTVCLYQPWLAQQRPDTAREYPTGQRLDAGLCPSNAAVQTYLVELVTDLLDQFPVGTVKLEGIVPPRYDYGWMRRRVYTALGPAQELALATCFCASCRDAAANRGIDTARARANALDVLAMPSDRIIDDDLDAFTSVARDSSVTLTRALADAVHRAGARIAVPTPVDGLSPGVPIERVLDIADVIMLAGLPSDRSALTHTVEVMERRTPRPQLEYFVHPPFAGHTAGGIPAGIREDLDDPQWHAHLAEVRALGIDRLSLYNYGLLTPTVFDRLVTVARD